MKKIILILIVAFVGVTSYSQKKEKTQCKLLIFSCPPTDAKICNNSKKYEELNAMNGLDGIYIKDKNGCWVVSGKTKPIPSEKVKLIERIRKLFCKNSIK